MKFDILRFEFSSTSQSNREATGKIKSKFFLSLFILNLFILSSCNFFEPDMEVININVQLINSYTKEPRVGNTVTLRKVKKPWYSMWQYIEVDEGVTDSLGILSFTIDRNKRHSFSCYGPYPEFGSTEYDERELNENDEIIIEVIPADKKKFKL